MNPPFVDREDAGAQLAERLRELELVRPVVLGIPRGGVVLAAIIAREIGGDVDVVLARKLRAPGRPELAIGAIAEDGTVLLDETTRHAPGVDEAYVARERAAQMAEIARRREWYRRLRPRVSLTGRTAIVTDDGIATGSTMVAALETLRTQQPRRLVAAIPVAPADRLPAISRRCDEIVCLHQPRRFLAVGQFYRRFVQVEDDEVERVLAGGTSRD